MGLRLTIDLLIGYGLLYGKHSAVSRQPSAVSLGHATPMATLRQWLTLLEVQT
ncbi:MULTISPECIES: hypothetical protein [Moorena]|uniref:Uncharacterized protein n=1 Tax=Moorena producens (strain JHB) TaxID=1454205 RepID=A0A9Q9UWH3_MOOP1|nr:MULTISPECIES: hypothetical protein [Moorena]NEQ17497.1 hypothetical protein [Moorena sp. SIO3E2]NEQ07768.1 hypothetical protein [Moorena sp. SIO4E2]NEQ07770.1 hypothetical protein [Moorena sp. SIO4E2]NES41455.1 hypothetical protein [Moorena sp. SIO2C4]NET68416.1 hypothetical protein [Moorena sp. SIO1G6]